ncbi:MAG: hypothetical protein IPL23_15725 [Saprospiraceae bacterium]|nr:hypothetical protein [Saprospiraceae bacterium]
MEVTNRAKTTDEIKMNYDFFADKADKLEILEFIFKETDLYLYDLGSPYGQEIFQYTTKWEDTNNANGPVSSWDWTEIQATSRKLKYHIHNKLATRKIGSFGVLSGADKLEKKGIILR